MDIPLPIPCYELIGTLKKGDRVGAWCELLGCVSTGTVTKPIGVNEWEMIANKHAFSVNPGNIVSVNRSKHNQKIVKDKPKKEPKSPKPPERP